MAKVSVLRGEEVLLGFTLGERPMTLGRGHESDVHIPDKRLSRQHCRLEIEGGRVLVSDLGSTNGTFYRGERVEKTALQEEDEFSMGEVKVTLRPDKLRLGTIEFGVPGEQAVVGAASDLLDRTGVFRPPLLPPPPTPKGLVDCARRLEKVVDDLSAIYDEFERAAKRDLALGELVRRLRDITIEAEALIGD